MIKMKTLKNKSIREANKMRKIFNSELCKKKLKKVGYEKEFFVVFGVGMNLNVRCSALTNLHSQGLSSPRRHCTEGTTI